MLYIVIKQSVLALITLLGVSLLLFTLVNTTQLDDLQPLLSSLDERQPEGVVKEYFNYLKNLIEGRWGYSIASHQSIFQECLSLLPATLELMIIAALLALLVGVIAGVLAGYYENSWFDRTILTVSFVGYSTPIFWLGLLSILYISLSLGITPVSGRIGFLFEIEPVTGFILIDLFLNDIANVQEPLISIFNHLILPATVLSIVPMAVVSRMTRNAIIESLNSDYIQAAYAKGLSSTKIIWVHGLRNAMLSVMPTLSMQVGALMMGALVVETIFSWPGIGKWLIESVNRRDLPAIHGAILVLVIMIILTNAMIDIIYSLINPRIRKK